MSFTKLIAIVLCVTNVIEMAFAVPDFGKRIGQEQFFPTQIRRQVVQPSNTLSPPQPFTVGPDSETNFDDENEEFPYFTVLPPGLRFSCRGRPQGFYADPTTRCQVYHQCLTDGRRYSFLCGVGTIFNQKNFICDHWYNYNCDEAEKDAAFNVDVFGFHEENANLLKE